LNKSNSSTIKKIALHRKDAFYLFFIRYAIFVFFSFIYICIAIYKPVFLSPANIADIMLTSSLVSFVSFGLSIVISAGGLDLSFPNIAGYGAMLSTYLMVEIGYPVWVCIVAGIMVGVVIGVFNGLMVTRLYINSFIATLGTLFILRGFLYWLTEGQSMQMLPESFEYLGRGTLLGVRMPVYFMGGIFILCHLFMENTRYGREISMVGGNMEACRLSGVDIKAMTLLSFVICGLLSPLSGMLQAASASAAAVDIGDRFMVPAFAAAMMGTVIFQGKNIILGTLFGIIFVESLNNAANILGVSPEIRRVVPGLVLLSTIAFNYYSKRAISKMQIT
jgi:ribose/xylose/arabinose/galactoside ABC-type transport system permease subunit